MKKDSGYQSVPSHHYYQAFKVFTSFPLLRQFLQSNYQHCIQDLQKIHFTADFTQKNFSCLQCGTSGEVTSDAFISFVIQKNDSSQITIIDYGEQQIKAVRKVVKEKYPDKNIIIKQLNALNLTRHFAKASFDWIETDGFIEYFDNQTLSLLLKQWKSLLKKDGFITTRDFVSRNRFDDIIDTIRFYIGNRLKISCINHV